MSCPLPLALISSSCWSGAFLVLLSVGCAPGSRFFCLPGHLPPSLPSSFFSFVAVFPLLSQFELCGWGWTFGCCNRWEDFVHSSASFWAVPLKQVILLLPACHLGRQQAWQVCSADRAHLTSAMWNGSRDFYLVSLLLFYVSTRISPEGNPRKLSGSFLCSGQDQIHPCPFWLMFA